MATLQKQIADKFLARLATSPDIDSDKIERLRRALDDTKKFKAEDVIKIFSLPNGGDIT